MYQKLHEIFYRLLWFAKFKSLRSTISFQLTSALRLWIQKCFCLTLFYSFIKPLFTYAPSVNFILIRYTSFFCSFKFEYCGISVYPIFPKQETKIGAKHYATILFKYQIFFVLIVKVQHNNRWSYFFVIIFDNFVITMWFMVLLTVSTTCSSHFLFSSGL